MMAILDIYLACTALVLMLFEDAQMRDDPHRAEDETAMSLDGATSGADERTPS